MVSGFLLVLQKLLSLVVFITEDEESSAGDVTFTSTGLALEAIVQRLPTCVNKDFIDEVLLNQAKCNLGKLKVKPVQRFHQFYVGGEGFAGML